MEVVKYLFYPALSIYVLAYWFSKCADILKLSFGKSFLLALFHEIACATCAVAMSFVEAGFHFSEATTYRLYGLMFFMPVFCVLFAKKHGVDMKNTFDVMSVAIMLRLVIGRIDCLFSGCCRGILLISSSRIRWPIRELEICYYIIMICIFVKRLRLKKFNGALYPIYLITYGFFRFLIEWLREEYVQSKGIFHMAHFWSLIAIIGGAIALYSVRKHQEEKRTHSKHSQLQRKETVK